MRLRTFADSLDKGHLPLETSFSTMVSQVKKFFFTLLQPILQMKGIYVNTQCSLKTVFAFTVPYSG